MKNRSFSVAYGVALVSIALAILARQLLDPLLADNVPFITLFAATSFATWYDGRGPGVFSLFAGALGAAIFLLSPRYSFVIERQEDRFALLIFIVFNAVLIALVDSLRQARLLAVTQRQANEEEIARRITAEQSLADREHLWRITLGSIGDAVITTSADKIITSINPRAEELTGWTRDEAIGKPLDAVFRVIDAATGQAATSPAIRASMENQTVELNDPTVLLSKGGAERRIENSAAPIRKSDGLVLGIVLVFRDVTERKRIEHQLQQSEQRFAQFMQHLPGLAWIKDLQGRYLYVNDSAERAFGVPRDRLYGKTDAEVFPSDTALQFTSNDAAAVSTRTSIQVIETLIQPDGEVHHSLVSKFPISDSFGEITFIAGMAIDVSEQRRVEYELVKSEERFRGLMEQAPFSIQVFAPDGRTIRVNQAWEELWGVRFSQILDYNILEDAQLEAKGIAPYLRRAFAGEAVEIPAIEYDPEETIPNRSSNANPRRWVAAVAYPIKDETGRVREVILVHDDITKEKIADASLKESNRLYRAIGESIDYGVWVCDAEGRNTYASQSFLKLVGMTQDQCSSLGWGDVLHPDDAARTLDAWQKCVRDGTQWDAEHRFKGTDGNWHFVLARGVPVRNDQGAITSWAGINLDISRLKQVELELRDADRRKDEFLATLAHELRNPLAPIRNSLQILKMPRVDSTMAHQTMEMMERQVHHLVRLVDDLLDVSRVMRGKIDLRKEHIELSSVVARAVETNMPLLDKHNHKLEISVPDEPLIIDADPIRMAQVVGNILANAAKYSEPNGQIWLTAAAECGQVILRIRDCGIGISPQFLPQVFDLFVQADHSATKSHGGLGIGLTLVKNLLELHGGEITANSDGLGTGSEFVIRLPLLKESPIGEAVEKVAESKPDSGIETLRLLVADDNSDSATTLARLLRLHGHEVQVAFDGPTALKILKSYLPDLIFLDIGMPGMDGNKVAQQIRQVPELKSAVLVALTGWGQPEERRKTTEAGFDHHFVKPIEMAALKKLLSSVRTLRTTQS